MGEPGQGEEGECALPGSCALNCQPWKVPEGPEQEAGGLSENKGEEAQVRVQYWRCRNRESQKLASARFNHKQGAQVRHGRGCEQANLQGASRIHLVDTTEV